MTDGAMTAGSGADAHAELIATHDAWSNAIVSNDSEQIANYLAAEWVMVSDRGVGTKDEFLELITSGALTHSAMERTNEASVRVYGDTAFLTARVTNTSYYGGERIDADDWTTDVFVRRDDRWVCVMTHVTAAAHASIP